MKLKKSRNIGVAAVVFSLLGGMFSTSCNSDTESTEQDVLINSAVAVQGFKLKSDSKVMSDLDSVFFSIDLNNGVIFNADSLPKGTDVSKLIPVITLPSLDKAVITMEGGTTREGEVDYLKNPSDSIDFTGRVYLDLTALDGVTTRKYQLKVNVHLMDPDSLMWNDVAISRLPSRSAAPLQQKTAQRPDASATYSLIEEADGSHTLSVCQEAEMMKWTKQEVTLPANADIRSFCVGADTMYLLAGKTLYSSADGLCWTEAETGWESLLGVYGDAALGVRNNGNGELIYSSYPAMEMASQEMDDDFPLYEGSNLCVFSNKWTPEPIVFFVGGRTVSGEVSSSVWGFDGDHWTSISLNAPPAVTGSTVVPYYTYIQTTSLWTKTEIAAWLMIGGKKSDGTLNTSVYVSYDTGVNWHEGDTPVQLPDFIPAMSEIDNVVSSLPKEGNFSDAWTILQHNNAPAGFRIAYQIDGYDVTWKCPYIYLFGGRDSQGKLCDTVWRGVLNRLTFIPIL